VGRNGIRAFANSNPGGKKGPRLRKRGPVQRPFWNRPVLVCGRPVARGNRVIPRREVVDTAKAVWYTRRRSPSPCLRPEARMARLTTQTSSGAAKTPSPRERELVRLICSGQSTGEAATAMGISAKTADKHRVHVMAKIGLGNAVELTHWAIGNGLVNIEMASDNANTLSAREREIVRLICSGLSTKQAAWLMGIQTSTAETHRNRAMRKLGIHSAVKLTRWAIATGLVKVINFGEAPTAGPADPKKNVA